MLNKFKDNMKESVDNFNKKSNNYLDIFNNKISTLNYKISKIKDIIKNNEILTNAEKNELQNKIEIISKEKNELEENIKVITSQKNNINNEHIKAVELIKKYKESKKYEDNLKTMEIIKELEEDFENAYQAIDMFTSNMYDPNGFDIYGNRKDTSNKYDPNGFVRDGYNINGVNKDGLDRYGIRRTAKKPSKIKTSEAESFKNQKGEGYVDLPILLFKLNINSSKELISNIEQLINDLYDNEKITKQVYNNLIKAITYKNDS